MASRAVLKVFLFTDLVDSTQLKERLGDVEASKLIVRHDEVFRDCLRRYSGTEEVNPGDAFFATFDLPSDAVRCALTFLNSLSELDDSESLKVRVGIHMGETTQVETTESGRHKLVGLAVDTAARVMGVAQPNQILLTRHAFDSVRQHVSQSPEGASIEWLAHGRYSFKGVNEPLEVFEVGVQSFSPLSPPSDSEKAKRVLTPGDEEKIPEVAKEKNTTVATDLSDVGDNLRDAISWSEVDWNTEKDSQPNGTDDGKEILAQLGDNLREYRVHLADRLSEDLLRYFDTMIREIKQIQRHQFFLDGGKSFSAFWKMGDRIVEKVKKLGREVGLATAAIDDSGYAGPFKGYSSDELTEILVHYIENCEAKHVDTCLSACNAPSGSFFDGKLIHYRELDDILELPPGASGVLFRDAAEKHGLKVKKATKNTILFESGFSS